MQYLLLGLLALIAVLFAMERFTRANPQIMAQQLRRIGGVTLLAVAAVFFLRGAVNQALLIGFAGTWLLGWRGSGSWSGFPGTATGTPGRVSGVTTETLEVELDHDTGAIGGRVLKGIFQGRRIESLKPVELAHLWQDCRFTDPQSAQILEAYLDRTHPTWREDMARGEAELHGGPDGRMSVAEAYDILGLKPGASEEAIRAAHRDLMKKLHPDRGGSTYLASKINEAKDVLLGA